MIFKKLAALLMAVILTAAVLTGCSKTANPPATASDAADTASPSADPSVTPTAVNLAGAYAALDPKTVMLTIDGNDVTWDMFFYYINSVIYDIQAQGGVISDMSEIFMDETTYKDYILDTATNIALQYGAIKYGAKQLDVGLTDEDKAAVQAAWDEGVTSAGSEEAYIAQLQNSFVSKDLFMEIMGMRYLYMDCFNAMFGADASKLTDEQVQDDTAADGYIMAKHILLLTTASDESGTETAMTDSEKAAVHAKMEDIISQLNSYSGDDFDAVFTDLMNKNSQDPGGLASFPNGYLFQEGDMVPEFYEAASKLEIGKLSDIVETTYGYHIIYRIPINYDVVPTAAANTGSTYTLRQMTAQNRFSAVADTWLNSQNVVYSDQYKALDFSKLFAAG